MNFIAVIPARWQSSRFPGKPLALLNDKSVIQHVYENVLNSGLFQQVIVATDSQIILDAVHAFGGTAQMTSSDHHSGTDRIAEVCQTLDFDVVVNVQGDEPFISSEPLKCLISAFLDPKVQVASLMHRISGKIDDHNQVKVVCDIHGYALYFSRSVIPFNRDYNSDVEYFGHVGVYAFRREALFKFIALPTAKLENIEKLEQLRLLENGIPIKMISTNYAGLGIDTPENLVQAKKLLHPNLTT
ncbi:MAG: 3-deoxy-manno-octulosonate cytidylyltransferase [Candidatus Cloacimonetes bacterium]|nr:3-deoxy-manno-octulosonate cytidylyltransferase [Candidatus Cloacimonadota bacterium]